MNNDDKITMKEHIRITGNYIDAVCHYRNLAIVLGAKPEQMTSDYDRWLCERGIDPSEDMHGLGNNVSDSLAELKDVWDENDRLHQKIEILVRALKASCVPGCSHEGEGGWDQEQRDRDYFQGFGILGEEDH
jgi:hypothetical protein